MQIPPESPCIHTHTHTMAHSVAALSHCVSVASVIQHAQRMRRIILSSVARPALPYFFRLSHKRHNYKKKKKPLNMKCVF